MNLEFFTSTLSNVLPKNDLIRKLILALVFIFILSGIYRNIWIIIFISLVVFMLFGTTEYFTMYDNIKSKLTNLFENNLSKTFLDYIQKIAINITNLKENICRMYAKKYPRELYMFEREYVCKEILKIMQNVLAYI